MSSELDPLARTALWTASMRAREHDRKDRLFEEPLAALLATDLGPKIMRSFEGEVQRGVEDPALAVRTRFFDDAILQAAAHGGVGQIVLVAAGMDTRGYRLRLPPSTHLFELDRPVLFELKRELLAEAGEQARVPVQMIGVDLLGDWIGPLLAGGFQPETPAVWLVEGLLYFLSPTERDRLLTEITATAAAGSLLLADYVTNASLDSEKMRSWREKMAASGHPWRSGCDDPHGLLGRLGWRTNVAAYGSAQADFGRWADAMIEPDTPATRGRYLISAVLESAVKAGEGGPHSERLDIDLAPNIAHDVRFDS
ncbi:SAM-dependent methyltransferase [Hamadaea sp. NPDC051192]|uniref:class I SAM-dependent methyltransferase n=1 Tax=Hamadaea sp. NPDC051192 TaxID=3154940 RepID=UPI0034154EAC